MPSAYIIASLRVTDAQKYAEYKRLSSHAMHTHEAEILVRQHAEQLGAGEDWDADRMLVLKFPSLQAARDFNASTEYGTSPIAGQGATIRQMILVEGAD
ncbi:MAG: hypothetical protein GAK30_01702 [Paracidovorax wautersii]|uniref:DUF1330 domain-containing protein n=1 Tax=Paracidovorax wautersii TaxID=1177982 RepID=A0A7V8JQF3_9BURK|nr:MAG: hypothetical protein GAK30_01702 [Paracidovorax wautersii]